MAVNLQVNVDPSKAEEGLKQIGQAAEQAADTTEDAFESAGNAAEASAKKSGKAAREAAREKTEAEREAARIAEEVAAKEEEIANQQAQVMKDLAAIDRKVAAAKKESALAEIEDVGKIKEANIELERQLYNLADAGELSNEKRLELLDEIAAGERRIQQITDRNTDAARKAESSTRGWESATTGLNSAWQLGKDAVEGVSRAINAMAENGNESAIQLQKSFGDFQKVLVEMGSDPRFQFMLESLAKTISGGLNPSMKSSGEAVLGWAESFQNSFSVASNRVLEFFGVAEKGSSDLMLHDQARRIFFAETHKKESEAAAAVEASNKAIADAQAQRAEAAEHASISEVRSSQRLTGMVAEMKKKIADVNTPMEERERLTRLILTAEERQVSLMEERKRVEDATKDALEELQKMESRHVETMEEKRKRLTDEVTSYKNALEMGIHTEAKANEVAGKMLTAKRELLQLEQQQKAEADAKLKREQEVSKEIERINGMAAEEDKRSKQTKEDLQRIAEEAQKKLEQGVESQEEQNKLLREMEDAKQRIMDMDRQAADERKRIADEEKRNAEEAKKRLMDGPQGEGIRNAASSREAVIDRIARETGRKRGTVGQMIDSGKISPTEINKAIEANVNDMVGSTVKQTGQVMGDVGNSLEQVGKVLGGHDVEMAQFRERVRRFEEFIKSYEENGRRRRARDNSA